jgi:hypothetical protein
MRLGTTHLASSLHILAPYNYRLYAADVCLILLAAYKTEDYLNDTGSPSRVGLLLSLACTTLHLL